MVMFEKSKQIASCGAFKSLCAINGVGRDDLAKYMGRSLTYVDNRLRGLQPWTLNDIYRLTELFGIPWESVPQMFPPTDEIKL